MHKYFLAAGAVIALAGCSNAPPKCTPGDSKSCTATSGCSGAQVCQSDGTYATCLCGSNGGGAGGGGGGSAGGGSAGGGSAGGGSAGGGSGGGGALGGGGGGGGGAGGGDAGVADPCDGGLCGPCDTGIALAESDPVIAAHAAGICGVTSAQWVKPDGTPATSSGAFDIGHGVMANFGANVLPQEGTRLLVLSSGTARTPNQVGYQDVGGDWKDMTPETEPTGFPFEAPACPGVVLDQPFDGTGLEVTLVVPPSANGFVIRHKFYSSEFPDYLCSAFNDLFAIMVSPMVGASPDVALDAQGNPISVNCSFVDVCTCSGGPPCVVGSRTFSCSAGVADLAGTGFDSIAGSASGAATRWLETTVPVSAGATIHVRFAIWDSGDGLLDSTVLLDGFRWVINAPSAPVTAVAP